MDVNFAQLPKFKQKHDYAVVMTCVGMLDGVNAFINGLDHHENHVDFFLIGKEAEEKYVENLVKPIKDLSVNVIFIPLDLCGKIWPVPEGTIKRQGWRVRFYRYAIANVVKDLYKSVCIVDADMLCVNNIMRYFELAENSKLLILPSNPWGCKVEKILDLGIEPLRGASSPPFHNMPMFIDPKYWSSFLEKIHFWGLNESWGDMVTVSRTIFRENLLDKVVTLPNLLWVHSSWYYDLIRKTTMREKYYLYCMEEKISMIHRRWWVPSVCAKFINAIKQEDALRKGINNARIFFDTYKKFNTGHKVKREFPYKWPDHKTKL